MASVCTASYGTPYPSLEDIESNLNLNEKEGFGAVVEKVFKDVYQQAEASSFKKSGFKNLKLIGEENGSLTLPNQGLPAHFNPGNYRDWQWKFNTIYRFFSCTVQDVSVFNEGTLRSAVEFSETARLGKTMLTRADTQRMTEIVKICRVLLSEAFAKRLLTEPLLQALYENKDVAYSCFDVKFSPDVFEKDIFRFDVMYSQTVKEEEREAKGASVFVLRFSFGYDLKSGVRVDNGGKCCGLIQPQLEYLRINRDSVRSNFLNFDERSMERVWWHPYWENTMCRGVEKILREEKKAVAEKEKRENSGKSKEGLGSEEEEEDWNDVFEEEEHENSEKSKKGMGLEEDEENLKVRAKEHKEDKASKSRDPNKRPRSFDSSEDEKSEENFKKKKE